MRVKGACVVAALAAAVAGTSVWAQRGGTTEWLTAGGDAQRTSWVRIDPAISVDAFDNPDAFALEWTATLENVPRQASMFGQGITTSGSSSVPLTLVTGSSNNLYAIDTDTGFITWSKHFDAPLPPVTPTCPGGITAAVTRIVPLSPMPLPMSAPTPLLAIAPHSGRPDIADAHGSLAVYVVSSDGMLRALDRQTGEDLQDPVPFLPPDAMSGDLMAVGTTIYATTSHNCGGAPSGVWAVDLQNASAPVLSWRTHGGSVVGPVAFTPSGILIVAVGPGRAAVDGFSNAIVALDPETLRVKNWYTAPDAAFTSGPLIFQHDDREMIAASTRDGRILLLDAAAPGGSNHATPLYASMPITPAGTEFMPGALAMWQDVDSAPDGTLLPGTRWLLAPVTGPPAAAFAANGSHGPVTNDAGNGLVTNGAVVALAVTTDNGRPALAPGWTSPDLTAPVTPVIVNGVVFAASTGRPAVPPSGDTAEIAALGTPAMIYALDGATGRPLWSSGTTITSFLTGRSFWSGNSRIQAGTYDGTLYAFGFPTDRN